MKALVGWLMFLIMFAVGCAFFVTLVAWAETADQVDVEMLPDNCVLVIETIGTFPFKYDETRTIYCEVQS